MIVLIKLCMHVCVWDVYIYEEEEIGWKNGTEQCSYYLKLYLFPHTNQLWKKERALTSHYVCVFIFVSFLLYCVVQVWNSLEDAAAAVNRGSLDNHTSLNLNYTMKKEFRVNVSDSDHLKPSNPSTNGENLT